MSDVLMGLSVVGYMFTVVLVTWIIAGRQKRRVARGGGRWLRKATTKP
jgi:hypothetical protein